MEFFGVCRISLALDNLRIGGYSNHRKSDEDGKLIRVVGMETENPSVAESTAKNPRERQMSFPFVVLGSTYGCARF